MSDLACDFDRSRLGRWHVSQPTLVPGSRSLHTETSHLAGSPPVTVGHRVPPSSSTPLRNAGSLSPDDASVALGQLRLHTHPDVKQSDERASRVISSDEKMWGLSEADDRSPDDDEISVHLQPKGQGPATALLTLADRLPPLGRVDAHSPVFSGGRCIFSDDDAPHPVAVPFDPPSPIHPDDDPNPAVEDQTFSDELSTARYYMNFSAHREIGEGDFGTVCRVQDDEDHRTYCIKRAKKASLGSDLQGRLQEVYALSVCRSPFILRYYDAWIEHDMVHIKTELAREGPISRRPTPWPETDLWEFLLQTALGLHSMHACNVAHLDIKPDNIFCDVDDVTNKPVYKIGDFGLARPIQAHSPVGEHFTGLNDEEGDFRYLPPEFSSSGRVRNVVEADIYSLGATMVQLLGVDPKLLRDVPVTSLSLPCSKALMVVLAAMLDLDHTRRPSAFELVVGALERIQQLHHDSGCAPLADPAYFDQLDRAREELAALQQEFRQLHARAEFHCGPLGYPSMVPSSSGFFSSVNNSIAHGTDFSDSECSASPVANAAPARPPLGPSSSARSLDATIPGRNG